MNIKTIDIDTISEQQGIANHVMRDIENLLDNPYDAVSVLFYEGNMQDIVNFLAAHNMPFEMRYRGVMENGRHALVEFIFEKKYYSRGDKKHD